MEGIQPEGSAQEKVVGAVTGIAVAGTATMAYWTIIRTDQAAYFIRTGSALGIGMGTGVVAMAAGVIGDVAGMASSKRAGASPLEEALAKAEESYRFADADFSKLTMKKGLFGGSIVFPNGREKSWRESGIVKLKLSGGKWKQFTALMGRQA